MFSNSTVYQAHQLTPGMIVACTDGNWHMCRTAMPWDENVYAAHVLTAPKQTTFATRYSHRRGHLMQYTFMAIISGRARLVYVPVAQLVAVGRSLQDWTSTPIPELTGAAA